MRLSIEKKVALACLSTLLVGLLRDRRLVNTISDSRSHRLAFRPAPIAAANNNSMNASQWHKDKSFASCLLIKDDNTILIEWLAYAWQVLPLRRLIIAIDPTSETMPTPILNRYRRYQLMEISEWKNDTWFVEKPRLLRQVQKRYNSTSSNEVLNAMHDRRQNFFYLHCMRKLQEEGYKWTAMIDTDEYITLNRKVSTIQTGLMNDEQPTVMQILNDPTRHPLIPSLNRTNMEKLRVESLPNASETACYPMSRLQVGTRESKDDITDNFRNDIPVGYSKSNFLTYRYRFHQNPAGYPVLPGKAIIDVSRAGDLTNVHPMTEINCHRPLKRICPKPWILYRHSPFVVHHYTGTLEQYLYRKDPRTNWTRTLSKWQEFNFSEEFSNTHAMGWLPGFISSVGGYEVANELLKDAGKIPERETPTSST